MANVGIWNSRFLFEKEDSCKNARLISRSHFTTSLVSTSLKQYVYSADFGENTRVKLA